MKQKTVKQAKSIKPKAGSSRRSISQTNQEKGGGIWITSIRKE